MGSFEGHAIPSIIYTILCIWWGFVTAVRYVNSQRQNKYKFQSSFAMPCFFCPTKTLRAFPFESFFKFTFLSIHSLLEYLMNSNGHKLPRTVVHHICMLSGFIVGAIFEILIWSGVPFPKKTEYIFTCLAFLIQSYLMMGHIHSEMNLEEHMHKGWAFVCFCTFIAIVLETYRNDCIWLVYARIFFMFVQGTWLMQIAFVVWPEKITTNPNFKWEINHESTSWLDVIMMYHWLGVAIFLMAQYMFVYCTFRFYYTCYRKYELELDQSKTLIIKVDTKNQIEYQHLMQENEQD